MCQNMRQIFKIEILLIISALYCVKGLVKPRELSLTNIGINRIGFYQCKYDYNGWLIAFVCDN